MLVPRLCNRLGVFYQFLCFHSLLIGLFPFYLPVFLWKEGYDLADISLFISVTGVGFCLCLWGWDRLHKRVPFSTIIFASFVIEALLLALVLGAGRPWFLPLLGLMNGAYNCFFWMVQRVLFLEMVSPENSGKNFGNFQIFVAITLKAGLFVGGTLLEHRGFSAVLLFSFVITLLGVVSFHLQRGCPRLPEQLLAAKPIGIGQLAGFRDRYSSRPVFLIDGIFLYLESYFWVVSLFLIVRQSFWQLGALVIVLTIIFSLLFILIKNRIDHMPGQRLYTLAVGLYVFSWVLRSQVSGSLPLSLLFVLLVVITFCTSFFRLAFNKRFFDRAKQGRDYSYLFFKSYYSQFGMACCFCLAGFFLAQTRIGIQALQYSYWLAAGMAMLYFLYSEREVGDHTSTGSI